MHTHMCRTTIVPGYWISVFTIDYMGRKTIQIMGFTMLTIMFIILGFAYHAILNTSTALFIVLYTITQIFFNWGPNTTTFIVRKYNAFIVILQ